MPFCSHTSTLTTPTFRRFAGSPAALRPSLRIPLENGLLATGSKPSASFVQGPS